MSKKQNQSSSATTITTKTNSPITTAPNNNNNNNNNSNNNNNNNNNNKTTTSINTIKEYKLFDFETKIQTAIKNNEFKDITLFPSLQKRRESKVLSSYANLTDNIPFKTEVFKVLDNSWQLLFIPHNSLPKSSTSSTSSSSNQWLSIYLISKDSKDFNKNLKVDYSIELYNYKKATTHLKLRSFEFTNLKPYSGFNQFINQNEFEIEDYYRASVPAYYFSIIITIDKVIEPVGISSISSNLKPYQDVNKLLEFISNLPLDITYYRSLILSLYFIPIFREELLRVTPKEPEKILYQLQRLFHHFILNKPVDDIYLYISIDYFAASNHFNKYEYPKFIEKIVSEVSTNSKVLQDRLPLNQVQLSKLNKIDYNEHIYGPEMFADKTNMLVLKKSAQLDLGGTMDKIIPSETVINSDFMKFLGEGSGNNGSGPLHINIPFGVECLNSSTFQDKLLESNSKLNKDSITNILYVSFLSKSLSLDISCQVKSNSDLICSRFPTFRFPDEFTIFKDKVYSLYSVWSYDKHETTPDIQDPSGTQITYLYDFNNKVWIKITPSSVEEVSFNYVVENSCGYNNDRLINNQITINNNLQRDLSFSYMLVYILKDKVNEFFNYKSNLPLPKYEEFKYLDDQLASTSLDEYESIFPAKPIRTTLSQLKPVEAATAAVVPEQPIISTEQFELQQQIEMLLQQQEDTQLQYKEKEKSLNQQIEQLKQIQLQLKEQIRNNNNNNNNNQQQQQQQSSLIASDNNDIVQELLNKINRLENDNRELNNKCRSLEVIAKEKAFVESQLKNQVDKIQLLESQVLFIHERVQENILLKHRDWQNEQYKFYDALQNSIIKYKLLEKENQDNIIQKNQLYQDKMKLSEEKSTLIEKNDELDKELTETKSQLSNIRHQIRKASQKGQKLPPSLLATSDHLTFDELKEQLNITESQLESYDYYQVLQLDKELIKLSERIRKDLKSKNKCNICFEKKKEIAYIPCGHYSSCDECSEDLKLCPLCRKEIKQKIKII